MRNTPTAEEWDKRFIDIGIHLSAGQIAQTIKSISGQIAGLTHVEFQPSLALAERATSYARVTASYIKAAELTESFSRFQLFCFLSYCVVLEELGLMPPDDINGIMRVTITDEGASEHFLKRLRTRVIWLHKEVVLKLVQAGWTISRATLLFFFSKFPCPLYGHQN